MQWQPVWAKGVYVGCAPGRRSKRLQPRVEGAGYIQQRVAANQSSSASPDWRVWGMGCMVLGHICVAVGYDGEISHVMGSSRLSAARFVNLMTGGC